MNKLAATPIPKLIISMSLPAILSMMVQALYNIVDSIFVSRISEDALTALSLAFPVQIILISCFVGLGIGINSAVSRKLGEGDKKTAANIAEHGYLIAIILYAIVALAGIFFIDDFFKLFTSNETILDYSITYTRIILFFSFGRILAQAGMSILQGSGEMIIPMRAQLIGTVFNIILDPILIFGFFGLPAMGVKGAAIATVAAQILSMFYIFLTFLRKKGHLQLDIKNFSYSGRIARSIILVGLPAAIMQGLVSVMLTGLNIILVGFSTTAVAVLGVYYKLQSFVFMPIFGISQAVMPIVGFNFGAKNKKRIIDALRFASLISVIYMTLGLLVFQLFPESLLNLFKSSAEMSTVGVTAFRRISLIFPLAAVTIILSTSFQATGKAYFSLIITFCRQLLILLPLAWFLGQQFGIDALWFSFIIAETVGLLLSGLIFSRINNTSLNFIDSK